MALLKNVFKERQGSAEQWQWSTKRKRILGFLHSRFEDLVIKTKYQKYIAVNKGSHSYFETSLAPQSKTFPAMIPSMRAICRCSHGRASNSLSLLESRRSAASFSSCFTCKLKGRKNKRVTSQKKAGNKRLSK